MTLFLMLPGSPIPDWLIFLIPLVVLLLLVQGGQRIHKWYKHRASHHVHMESDSVPGQMEDVEHPVA